MGTNGIESLFLDYANFSPDEGIQKFVKDFINKIIPFFCLSNEMKEHLESTLVLLSDFEDYQDRYKASQKLKELELKQKQLGSPLMLPLLIDTFMIIYGPSERSCLKICPYGEHLRKIIISEFFAEPQDIGCFKCRQLCFKKYLNEVISGKEYSQITWLKEFLVQGRNLFFNNLIVRENPSNSYFKEELKSIISWNAIIPGISISIFIDVVMSYSLGEFLLNNDRNKLIICQHCGKYAIARRVDQKNCSVCSHRGIKSKEQKKEAQRRWRAKKKEELESQKYEKRIKYYMTKLNFTRDEAKEFVDGDLESGMKL